MLRLSGCDNKFKSDSRVFQDLLKCVLRVLYEFEFESASTVLGVSRVLQGCWPVA